MATRQQHAKKMTAKRVKSAKEKIFKCINSLISFDYINPTTGKWNISKIARDTKTSRTTVYKYVKEKNIKKEKYE